MARQPIAGMVERNVPSQLEREDLTQAEFFRACLTGMIENDPAFMKYIRKYKD